MEEEGKGFPRFPFLFFFFVPEGWNGERLGRAHEGQRLVAVDRVRARILRHGELGLGGGHRLYEGGRRERERWSSKVAGMIPSPVRGNGEPLGRAEERERLVQARDEAAGIVHGRKLGPRAPHGLCGAIPKRGIRVRDSRAAINFIFNRQL